jgi:hypothetical protein
VLARAKPGTPHVRKDAGAQLPLPHRAAVTSGIRNEVTASDDNQARAAAVGVDSPPRRSGSPAISAEQVSG